MKNYILEFARWGGIVAICYTVVLLFELKVVFPIEERLLPSGSIFASLVFLPHAARVLSTVIVGPKAFFALFPTIFVVGYFLFDSYIDQHIALLLMDAAIGAGCAPLALLLLQFAQRNNPNFEMSLQNWRMVFVVGAVASVINSVARAALYGNFESVAQVSGLAFRVIVGDLIGLAVGLIALVFIFRLVRGRPIQS